MSISKKIVLVFDSEKGRHIADTISTSAKNFGYDVITFNAQEQPLDPCTGCFNCWIKTPGVCCQKATNSVPFLQQIINAEYVIYITKITFGGYSSHIKAYLERTEPLSHPFFTKRHGEMHHVGRYNTKMQILAIGYDGFSSEAESTFMEVIARNMVNACKSKNVPPSTFSTVYKNSDSELTEWINPLLEAK